MKYRVRTLPRAQHDVDRILHWLITDQQTPAGAKSWLEAYKTAAMALAEMPQQHGLAAENDDLDDEIRQFLFKSSRYGRTYCGLFVVEGRPNIFLAAPALRS